jgi:hypothetical protein
MIQKITFSLIRVLFFFSIILCTETNSYAQTIAPQPLDGLEKLCAGKSFNEFNITFSYVNFPAGTTFEVEMTDATGNFTTPPTYAPKVQPPTDISASQQSIKFALPTNLVGSEIYGFRIRSSVASASPSARVKNSINGSTDFPAYYKEFETAFFINNRSTSATICSGGSLTLSVDSDAPSPATFPNLKYKWYKDAVLIVGQSGKSLVVNAAGEYYSVVDYGACTDVNISSNRVKVISASSGSAATIDSSLGNPFCSNGTGTVLTATQGNTYVWKKNGTIITGATSRTYTTNESATYTVDVDFGGCKASGSINLSSNGFNANINVADTFEVQEGQTVNVTVTTDATSPTYEWYLNDNLIAGANTNSYLVAAVGNYKAKISQATGCIATKELAFKVTGPAPPATVIPNIVSLSGSYPYWNVPDVYKTASTKIIILSSNGEIMFDDVGSNYDPQVNSFIKDFKNVNPVYYYVIQSDTGEKKGSITVIK